MFIVGLITFCLDRLFIPTLNENTNSTHSRNFFERLSRRVTKDIFILDIVTYAKRLLMQVPTLVTR